MENHKCSSLARISLHRSAAIYISCDSWSVSPKSNTPTVGNLTTSCGENSVAFDNFGPTILKIPLTGLLREYLFLVRGCLRFIFVRVSCPGHRFGAS